MKISNENYFSKLNEYNEIKSLYIRKQKELARAQDRLSHNSLGLYASSLLTSAFVICTIIVWSQREYALILGGAAILMIVGFLWALFAQSKLKTQQQAVIDSIVDELGSDPESAVVVPFLELHSYARNQRVLYECIVDFGLLSNEEARAAAFMQHLDKEGDAGTLSLPNNEQIIETLDVHLEQRKVTQTIS